MLYLSKLGGLEKMAILYGEDLTNALSFEDKLLGIEEHDSMDLYNKIEDLKNMDTSAKFSKEIWDRLTVRLDSFQTLLKTRIDLCNSLSSKTFKAITTMSNYYNSAYPLVGKNGAIDDSRIEEIQQRIDSVELNIANTKKDLKSLPNIQASNNSKAKCIRFIHYYESLLSSLNKAKGMLVALAEMDNEAYSAFAEVEEELIKFQQDINSIPYINLDIIKPLVEEESTEPENI